MIQPVDPHALTLPSDAHSAEREIDPALGALLGRSLGHFRIEALLGRGGMGAVFRAFDTSLQRPVALKVLVDATETSRTRFVREARAQAKIRHPNVVPIHFVGEDGETTFLVMDLVEGESLADLLHRQGVMDPERALDVADAIASALEAGWEAGLVHRDVKPSNILLDRRGRFLLADFGLAKASNETELPVESGAASSTALTRAGAILGTPAYLAPEQASGAAIDHRADIYALGVTLYEALVGQRPFTGETPTAIVRQHQEQAAIEPRLLAPTLRPALESLVMRMMQKKPDDRFPTYAELRAAIAASRDARAIPAPVFPRAVSFALDMLFAAIISGALALLLRIEAIAFAAALVQLAVLERVWSTPGKKLLRLRTVDQWNESPGFGRLILRWMIKGSGPLVALTAPILGATLGNVLGAIAIVGWIAGLLFALGARRMTLHDRVTRTHVVYALAG